VAELHAYRWLVSWINSERLQKLLAIENARDSKLLVNGIHELSEHESWQATHSAQLNGLKESQERIENSIREMGLQLTALLGRTETIPWTAEQIALIQARLAAPEVKPSPRKKRKKR
jgi:hypothetical protein